MAPAGDADVHQKAGSAAATAGTAAPSASAAASASSPSLSSWQVPLSVDLRALAFLRICIALVLMHDIWVRLSTFDIFYSDTGAWPLENHIRELGGEMLFSLFFACHHDLWQRAMFGLAVLLCTFFLLGYQTHWVKYGVWVMMISLQNRTTIGASGGDDLLAAVMCWCLFMPVSERFAVDAALQQRHQQPQRYEQTQPQQENQGTSASTPGDSAHSIAPPAAPVAASLSPPSCHAHLSVASFALVLQPTLMYVFSALLKTGTAWYPECTALWYALSGLDYVRPVGIWLRETAGFRLLQVVTFATLVLELVGPALFWSPWKHASLRIIAVALFCSFHFGIMATLALGNFPVVCCLVLLSLLPSQAWDALERAMRGVATVGLQDDAHAAPHADAAASPSQRNGEGQTPSSGARVRRRPVPLLLVMPRSSSSPTPTPMDPHTLFVESLVDRERVDAWRKVAALTTHFGWLVFEVEDGSNASSSGSGSGSSTDAGADSSSSAASTPAGASRRAAVAPTHDRRGQGRSPASLVLLDEYGHETRNDSALLALLCRSLPARLLRHVIGLRIEWFSVGFLPLFLLIRALSLSPTAVGWLHWLLPWTSPPCASSARSRWPHRSTPLRNLCCALLLFYVLLQNLSTVTWVRERWTSVAVINSPPLSHPAMLLKLDQRWAMFAPDPYKRVAWLVLRGELRLSAEELAQSPRPPARFVDAETLSLSSRVSFDRPALLSSKYDNVYYYDFIDNMEGQEEHYGPYAFYHCRRWNTHHATAAAATAADPGDVDSSGPRPRLLHQVDMFVMEHTVTLPHEPPVPIKKTLVWQQMCDTAATEGHDAAEES